MKQTTYTQCAQCQKQIEKRDAFHLDCSEIINPLTGELNMIGSDICLSCYRQKVKNHSAGYALP